MSEMIKNLNLNGDSRIYEMDMLMDTFFQRIRENPMVAPYERRLLGAFFEIDESYRRTTLQRVIDFMENCLKRELEQIGDLERKSKGDFRPIYEKEQSVQIVRHDDWASLLAHMPLVILTKYQHSFIWYTPRLAFYLSEHSISSKDLDEIRKHCLRRREAEQNVQQSPQKTLLKKNKENTDIPATSSGNEPRRRRNSSQTLVSDQYNCSICCHEYDLLMRRPMIITNCGHTFCQNCLTRLKDDRSACPDCRGSILTITENYAFKGLLEEKKRIQKKLDERKIALAQENEQRSLEAIRISLQADLDAKLLQKSTGDCLYPKTLMNQQQNQINHFEIAEMKRQLEEIRIKEQSEAEKRSLIELKLAQIGEKLERSESTIQESGLDKCAVLISGLPENKGLATRIFKDMQSTITDESLKIEFSQPASLGLVILRFQTNDSAKKFIEKYDNTLYGDTDCMMKMEYPTVGLNIRSVLPAQESSNISYTPQSPQVQQNYIPTIDRKRVFIQNLPAHATSQSIIKWIFNNNPNLVDGSITLNPFRQTETQICTARFNTEQDVVEIMAKFNNQPYPGTGNLLRVSMFNPPKTRSKSRDTYRQASTGNARLNRNASVSPPRASPRPISQPSYQVTTIPSSNRQIEQTDYSVPPPALPRPTQQENSTVLVSNLPSTTTRLDLIEYFHNKYLEGTEVRITDDLSINFIENGVASPQSKECCICFRTEREALLVQRYCTDRPFPPTGQRIKIVLWKSFIEQLTSGYQNLTGGSTMVLVKNLPSNIRIDEVIDTFHPVCKIAFNPSSLQPMINLMPAPDGSISAIICFKDREAAQKIVHLFRAHNYNRTGRVIQASLI